MYFLPSSVLTTGTFCHFLTNCPICGKFRRETIDLKDTLFKSIQDTLGNKVLNNSQIAVAPAPGVTATPISNATTIVTATPVNSALGVQLKKRVLKPGASTKLKITAFGQNLKKVKGTPRVLMITNDPNNPKIIIKVKVTSKK